MGVLSEQCAVKKEERDRLQEKYKEIEIKLSRAEVLMKSLGEEQVSEAHPPSHTNLAGNMKVLYLLQLRLMDD